MTAVELPGSGDAIYDPRGLTKMAERTVSGLGSPSPGRRLAVQIMIETARLYDEAAQRGNYDGAIKCASFMVKQLFPALGLNDDSKGEQLEFEWPDADSRPDLRDTG
jgi:hypothetical protein